MKIWVPINPVPASRPRVAKWGTYYPKTYTKFRKEAKEYISKMSRSPIDYYFSLRCLIQVKRPKTSKLEYPNGDFDNYLKAIMDAGNEYLWTDDKLWKAMHGTSSLEFTDDEPGYTLWIKKL